MRLFKVAFFYFSIGLKNRKMRILTKAKTKASLSNPRCPITLFQSSRKSPHIPVLFVPESCIVSSNEDGVCYKILCNHLWLGIVINNNELTSKQITASRIGIVILGVIMLAFPICADVAYIQKQYKHYKKSEKKRARKARRNSKTTQ